MPLPYFSDLCLCWPQMKKFNILLKDGLNCQYYSFGCSYLLGLIKSFAKMLE